jgi:excisionase family DNA binding protein
MEFNKNKEFYSVKELADLLQLSRVTIFKRIKKGEIKAEKIGRNFVIQKKDINDLILDGLTEGVKKEIEKGVRKVIAEYGDVLKKLGKE